MTRGTAIIAIDGPAASGKGTLARGLAQALDFDLLDTGAIYRSVALAAIRGGLDPEESPEAVSALAGEVCGRLRLEDLHDPVLRSDEVAQMTSRCSVIPGVRVALMDFQRHFAHYPPGGIGAVLDGRDIGTVVCPDAPLKFFVTARPEIRADRRAKELQSRGIDVTYEAVLADMRARDARDEGREAAPTRAAEDAVLLDTSDMDVRAVLETALETARRRLRPRS